MSGDYDRLRNLLLQPESKRLEALEASMRDASSRLEQVPELLAEDIEQSLRTGRSSRLSEALAEASTGSLELAVRRRPRAVVSAVYPVIGPAIRRSLGEALRQMADDFDHALRETFSLRVLRWRLEAWRTGIPYAWVVLRHTTHYQVEHLFLTEPESGLLLGHRTAQGLPELDADAVAGMFTAINQFVCDSVLVDGAEGGIGSATVGGYRLMVSEGPQACLVAFVRGMPASDFDIQLDVLNEEIHARHGRFLLDRAASGDDGPELIEPAQLDELNRGHARMPGSAGPHRVHLYLILAAVVVALGIWGWFGYRWSSTSSSVRESLSAEPGLLVTGWDDGKRGRIVIEGLLDPLAEGVKTRLAGRHPDVDIEWKTRPFVSLEPGIVRRRVAALLGLEEGNVEVAQAGVVRLRGQVPFARWDAANRAAATLPGVTQLDASGLGYPGQARIEALIARIQSVSIMFDSGTAQPDEDMERVVEAMLRDIVELQGEGRRHGVAFRLRTLGFTDESGSYVQNRTLRQKRAEWLATRVMSALTPPSTVVIDLEAVHTLPGSTVRATSILIEPFPVEP